MSNMNNKTNSRVSGAGCCAEPFSWTILLAIGGMLKVLCVGVYNFIRRKESSAGTVTSQLKAIYDTMVARLKGVEIH